MTENDTPDGRLRVALVGCGRIARAHMDAYAKLTDQAEVAAFVDRDLARAQAFAEEYGVRHALADIPAACGAAGPEAVDLCLPPSEHCPMTVQAADAGCHVLVEKPLSVTCAQADEMIEAGRRNGVVVMSGQSRRFNGPLRAMKRILDDGAIGAPLLAGIIGGGPTRQAATPWWADPAVTGPSNLLYNWGSHFLDWLRYLYGVPCRLYAEGRDTGDVVAGIDTLSVVCGFASSDLIATVCWTYRTQALAGGLHCCCGTRSWHPNRTATSATSRDSTPTCDSSRRRCWPATWRPSRVSWTRCRSPASSCGTTWSAASPDEPSPTTGSSTRRSRRSTG